MARTKARPGVLTAQALALLERFESRNVTFIDPEGGWPIVWERAKGCHVWDVEGRKYLDLTAAFGVAAAGHGHPKVVRAGKAQMGRLLHAMGDVHPHRLKAELARELSALTFERWTRGAKAGRTTAKVIFGSSGFEAVEAALKTACLATGRRAVLAFEGGYHGLGYGALNATHRGHFRSPFLAQIGGFGVFAPFPSRLEELAGLRKTILEACRKEPIGAILVEPIQARGGVRVPPEGFLPMLRQVADECGALLVLDEIYTGFGRTGEWFACEHEQTWPDLICLGKALTGGFPLSACVGRAELMDRAWPKSNGEAIHTSTFLGHPVGCAMALAQIGVLKAEKLVQASAARGREFKVLLEGLIAPKGLRMEVRGIGLMLGLDLQTSERQPAIKEALHVVKDMLQRGYILLPEGEHGNVIGLTPPLSLSTRQIEQTALALGESLAQVATATSPVKRPGKASH